MLTPSSLASVVTSASTPGRSGTGTRTSASSSGRADAAPAGSPAPRGPARARRSSAVAVAVRPRRRACRASAPIEPVEHVDDGVAVLGADVGPDAGVARRRCGSCRGSRRRPGAAGRACSSAPLGGQRHQRGRGEVGHVGHHGDQRVVALGRQRDDLGAERRHDRAHARVGRRRRCRRVGVSTHAAPCEQVGVGAVDALLLRARPSGGRRRSGGRSTARDDRRLHAADVGDDAAARRARAGASAGDRRHRRGDERELGVGVVARRRRARRARAPARRARSSRSRPVTCQPRARRARPIEPPISPVPTTRPPRPGSARGGRRAGPGPPRGRRGAARRGRGRC